MSVFSRLGVLALVIGASAVIGCREEPPPPQYPPQPYPPQPYPQPYPQPQAYPPPAPVPAPVPAPPTTSPPATTGTPTAIPGIEKRPDGTCWATPPALGGAPPQPFQLPCPPGI